MRQRLSPEVSKPKVTALPDLIAVAVPIVLEGVAADVEADVMAELLPGDPRGIAPGEVIQDDIALGHRELVAGL
jgi:hypothetical protein